MSAARVEKVKSKEQGFSLLERLGSVRIPPEECPNPRKGREEANLPNETSEALHPIFPTAV